MRAGKPLLLCVSMNNNDDFPLDDPRLTYACLNDFEKFYIQKLYAYCVTARNNKSSKLPRFEGSETGIKSIFQCFNSLHSDSVFFDQNGKTRDHCFHHKMQMFISRKLSSAQKSAYFEFQKNFFGSTVGTATYADLLLSLRRHQPPFWVSHKVDVEESNYLASLSSPQVLASLVE